MTTLPALGVCGPWRTALQGGYPSGALILKPCKFAVKPVRDRRATATVKVPGTCSREAALDRALVKDSAAPIGRMARTERCPAL